MHLRTLIFVVGIACGIVVGYRSTFGSEAALASLFLFLVQGSIYFLQKKFFRGEGVQLKISLVTTLTMILSAAFFIGIVRMQFVEKEATFVCETACTFTGRVTTHPEVKDVYQVFDVKVSDHKNMMDVRIRTPLYPKYKVGDSVVLTGKVTEPSLMYPHGDTKSFDYENYLRTKNVGSEMYYPKIVVEENPPEKSFTEKLMLIKEFLVLTINYFVSSPAASLASGMLLGESGMSRDLVETFRVAGLSHIVVLSGFNIAILIAMLLFIFKPLPIVVRVISASVFVVMFVLMVGGEASVLRATLMAFVSLLALVIGRGYVAHQALLFSFLLIILWSPLSLLYDVSLHLSFLATLGIVYTNESVKEFTKSFSSGAYQEILGTTLSAYIVTLPYVMYTFGTASVYAIVTNLLVLPIVPPIMFLTAVVVLLSPVSVFLGHTFGYAVTLLCDYIIWVARFVEGLPYASFLVEVSLSSMLLLYLGIVSLYIFFVRSKKNETQLTKDGEIISGVLSY